jgi:hypothetical protein
VIPNFNVNQLFVQFDVVNMQYNLTLAQPNPAIPGS